MKRLLLLLLALPGLCVAATPTVVSEGSQATAVGPNEPRTVAVSVGSPSAGQLLVVIGTCLNTSFTDTPTITPPGGWATATTRSGGNMRTSVFTLNSAAGTEGADENFTISNTGADDACGWYYYRISGHSTSQAPEAVDIATSLSNTQDPPNITPTGGSKDYLFIASANSRGDNTVTGFPSGYGNTAVLSPGGLGNGRAVGVGRKAATTTADNPSAFTVTGTAREGNAVTIAVHPASAVTPTFTSAPAIGTRTTSSIPINFTSDTTGTVYGVRCPDGQTTPTAAQVAAGNCTGNVAAVQAWSESVVATVADSHAFSGITNGTLSDGSFVIDAGGANYSSVATIADMYKLPAFTVNPTVSAQTHNTYTISKTLDGAGTVYAAACLKDASAPSVSQVEAGTGGCISVAANDDATGTFALGGALSLPVYDLYVVGTYGSQHEAAVHALIDELLDAPAGYLTYVVFGTIGSESTNLLKVFNDAETPDIVSGDYGTCVDGTDPDDYVVSLFDDGNILFDGPATAQLISCRYYDVSAGGWHAEAEPGDQADYYINWQAPTLPGGPDYTAALNVGAAITTIALSGMVVDPQDSTLTYAVTTGSPPAGLSLNTSTGDITGTPTTENESGVAFVVTATNEAGQSAAINVLLYPYVTFTMINGVNTPLTDFQAALQATHAGLDLSDAPGSIGYAYHTSYVAGRVISHSPAAGVEVEPNSTVTAVVSLGIATPTPVVNGYTFAIDPDEAATLYGVALRRHSVAPDCAEIQAHTDGSGNPAMAYGSVISIAGEQVTLAIEPVSVPKTDVYIVGLNEEDECSAITPYIGILKSPETGTNYVEVNVP